MNAVRTRQGARRRHTATAPTPHLSRADRTLLTALIGTVVLLQLVLVWGPAVVVLVLSFLNWDGAGEISPAGWNNYTSIIEYPTFWLALRNNLLWFAVLGFVGVPLGLFFAVVLDSQLRYRRFYTSALYLPVVMAPAVVGFLAQLIFSRDHGLLNAVLPAGLRVDWIGDPRFNIWAVLSLALWHHVGYVMIVYLAWLRTVDATLPEAATLDGAGRWRSFRHVALPNLRPAHIVVAILTTVEAARAFDLVYALNRGRNGLELMSTLVMQNGLGEPGRVGFSAALASVLLLLALTPIVLLLLLARRRRVW